MNEHRKIGPDWLVLVPTRMELDLLARCEQVYSVARPVIVVEVCGFGPIAAGVNTARLIEQAQPRAVMLVGIAGSFRPELPPGSAACFSEVVCYGLGAGEGTDFVPSESFGYRSSGESVPMGSDVQESRIDLDGALPNQRCALLTATSAAGDSLDRENRLGWYPHAAAEDLEGYAVAVACRNADKPLCIIRGISNWVGDRDRQNWRIEEAIIAAGRMSAERLER